MSNLISTLFDPCNISAICSGIMCMLVTIIGLHYSGYCLPVLDYVKFTAICILMYFYYQITIKQKSPVCGTKGLSMWSSICLCMLISIGILGGLCYRFDEIGEAAGYGLLIFCVFPYTLCCIFRLYATKGPFSADFWNPKTITKIYM